MASLRKRNGSPHWYLDWHEFPGNKGRRVLCTGIRHNNVKSPPRKGVAWEILLAKESELANRKHGLRQALKDTELRPFFDERLRWMETTRKDMSRGTLIRYASVFTAFLRWADAERLTHFSSFNYDVAARYVLHRSTLRSSKTVHVDCSLLAQVWDEAKSRSHVRFDENPWRKARPKHVKCAKRRALTRAEILYLTARLSSLEKWEHYVFLVALYTGARLTSIVLLPKSCVDLTAKLVSFPDEIVKEAPYTVPIHPAIIAFLAKYKGGDKTLFVPADIRQRHVQYHFAQKKLQDRFNQWRDATSKANPPGLFHGVSFHCLRHTFITALRESGASQSEAQLLAGHATAAINDAYTHVAAERLAPVIQRLSFGP